MKLGIRPNLNKKGQVSIHNGPLGNVLRYEEKITVLVTSSLVRKGAAKRIKDGASKFPMASLVGEEIGFIQPTPNAKRVQYNPKTDDDFHIGGEPLNFPMKVTFIGWTPYLVE